ncbi:MAG: pilus assembly protein [Desulfobulbus propionicus]|nr:MAG: pilus assembly protein [Desulfobulbus propionicus]
MRKLRINHNEKGFTLIELMIVIAIIGILSAIAIPNFISYRNKTYCSAVESDVNNIAAAVSDYFSEPNHTSIPAMADLRGIELSPSSTNAVLGGDANQTINISVTDDSGRCPRGNTYRKVMGAAEGVWN